MRLVIAPFLLFQPLAAQVSYNPQAIAFGAVKLGQTSAVVSSTLKNTGTDTLRFPGGSSMTGSSAFQWVTDNCTPRPPGGTCVLQYRFAPKSVGPLTGANIVMTNHGPFPLNFTGTGVDTVTPPPSPPSIVAGVRGNPIAVTLVEGSATAVYAVAADSLGQPLGTPITWSSSSPAVAVIRLPYGGVPQAADLAAVSPGVATITASAGGKFTMIGVTVTAKPPSPPSVPPVFGIRAAWLGTFLIGCTATAGTPCARGPLPVLADSDGHVISYVTVTATFTAP